MALTKEIEIVNEKGLHARAAAKLVATADPFEAEILVEASGESVSALSIMGLMMLGAAKESTVTISVSGSDEQAALDAVTRLISDGFGEDK
jgi:phosphocarrier protein HPr